MKIFLISPVRTLDTLTFHEISAYVTKLASEGHVVYWPVIGTNQRQKEMAICQENKEAIIKADEIHIWYDVDSLGSIFDLGMAWALNKKLVIANDVDGSYEKSFANLIIDWSSQKEVI